jgi:hypothetical protein
MKIARRGFLGRKPRKGYRFDLHQLRNCLALLLRTRSEKEEDGSGDRIKNGGGYVVRGPEFDNRTREKADGCRKVEISGLHLLNSNAVNG